MKVKVEYKEIVETTEEYDLNEDEIEDLKNGDEDIFDLTEIECDAESHGKNYIKVNVYNDRNEKIWSC